VQQLDDAKQLFYKDSDWGEFYGDKFRVEAEQVLSMPPSAVKGIFLPCGKLVGVGVVQKEGFDYAYWSLTWIMVDSDYRNQGLGRVVVDTLLDHAKTEQAKSHNPNCRVLISAVVGQHEFYSRGWGFKTLAEGPLPGERLMMLDATGPGLPLRPQR
jgi:GNAT superfamily N-acetyltransferase